MTALLRSEKSVSLRGALGDRTEYLGTERCREVPSAVAGLFVFLLPLCLPFVGFALHIFVFVITSQPQH